MALCAGWQGERVCELLREDAEIRVLRCTFRRASAMRCCVKLIASGNSVMRITTATGVVDRPVRAGTSFSNDAESSTRR
jgi:hypothetical protein